MDNQTKLRYWGLEEKYYYLKYGENRHGNAILGTATVCVIPTLPPGHTVCSDPVYVRGVAFCNPIDQFSRKKGRAIALGRAVKAIESRQFLDPIPTFKPVSILRRMYGWNFLSSYDINLTEFEAKLFKRMDAEGNRKETEGG